jgi:hypothetical protein
VAELLPLQSPRAGHEPERKLLGQRGGGVLLRWPEEERIKKQIYRNPELALSDVADYIVTLCNRTRRHSHLGGLSPEQFEAAHKSRRQGVH